MVRKREEWPEIGECVIATVREIAPHGVYALLDEYGDKEGYIHIGELSTTWVKNIRDFARENQKIVARVQRVDQSKGHIDLSLKRATEQARRQKIYEWKRGQKAQNLLQMAAEKLGKTMDQAYEEAGWKMEDAFNEIYLGFEQAVERGEDVLTKAGVPEDWAKAIKQCADAYIQLHKVKVERLLELRCYKSDGIEAIRQSLLKAIKETSSSDFEVNVALIGTPRYRITVTAKDYKIAEKEIDKTVAVALDELRANGGEGAVVKS
ncbi:MAG: translation initiation factor IF-2 subunit alpha [Promethearchaeati archaeon SRVP18_Atabeyarchaeia-1]